MNQTIMEVKAFGFAYPENKNLLLEGLELTIKSGEFLLLCGPSGGGKTTFLRCLKPQIAPVGTRTGSVTELGAGEVGFVFQNPDNQIVTDTVRHELAFGLENLGLPTECIRRRVAETALFFGIDEWIDRSVHEISGGQKQLLNLAAVIAMRPRILLLDEPTAQLDPVATRNFVELLSRVNRELGIAVLLSEHHLEQLLPLADRVLFMDDGRLTFMGPRDEFVSCMVHDKPGYKRALPAAVRAAEALDGPWREKGVDKWPFTVREGIEYLNGYLEKRSGTSEAGERLEQFRILETEAVQPSLLLHVDHIWFQYEKQTPFVLKGLELKVHAGEFHAVLGGNGSGKTTLLHILGKRLYANRGKIRLGKSRKMPSIGLLPQNPKGMFSYDTVSEELHAAGCSHEMTEQMHLEGLLERHPYDLSGGEQQRLGLAMVLAKQPQVLLLDEPTKGLDPFLKEELAGELKAYAAEGRAVLCVTHDVDFAADYADVCSMLFEGEVLSTEKTKAFFSDNAFYTTDMARILRGFQSF